MSPNGAFECGDIFKAVERAFKMFYILNAEFPPATFVVWSVIQLLVYKAAGGPVPPQVDSFARAIREGDKENRD